MTSILSTLQNKHILLIVTGSIAAYKSADCIRRLQDKGAEVRVVMTPAAAEFITPLTLQTLSGHPVATTLLDTEQESTMGHITLARWADWVLIAPATADSLARLVEGRANDLMSALCLATEAPIAVAPAMNNKMWSNTVTQDNLAKLKQQGVYVLGPASGDQACGEQGEGRLLEPSDIIAELEHCVVPQALAGKQVLITAGPTHEPIDPVRYIGNRSSGKMGFAVAKAAQEAGAKVTLVAGPTGLMTPTGVQRIDVQTANDMLKVIEKHAVQADIFIGCAAVADYTPAQVAMEKIKKTDSDNLELKLVPTTDIINQVSTMVEHRPFTVGFAAETVRLADYAKDKLVGKSLDMVAANVVGEGLGFGMDDNALQVFWSQGEKQLPIANKSQLARQLMTLIVERYDAKNSI